MKKLSILLICILILFSILSGSVLAEDLTINMRDAMWGEQGSEGWYYYGYENGEYFLLEYDEDGGRFLLDAYQYLEIYSNGAHPTTDPAVSTVRAYEVAFAGEIEITWEVAPSNGSYYVNDGVSINVLNNTEKIFPQDEEVQIVNNPVGKPYPSGGDSDFIETPEIFVFTTEVLENDILYFHLYNNLTANYDRTKYDITIKYLRLDSQPTPEPTVEPTPEPTIQESSESPVSSQEPNENNAQENYLVYIIIGAVGIVALIGIILLVVKKKK